MNACLDGGKGCITRSTPCSLRCDDISHEHAGYPTCRSRPSAADGSIFQSYSPSPHASYPSDTPTNTDSRSSCYTEARLMCFGGWMISPVSLLLHGLGPPATEHVEESSKMQAL